MRYKFLDTEDWEEWQQSMAHFFSKPYVRGYWHATRRRYARSFQDFTEGVIAQSGFSAEEGQRPPG